MNAEKSNLSENRTDGLSFFGVAIFFLLHIILAKIAKASVFISSIYAFTIVLTGLYFLLNDRDTDRLIYVIIYIVGAEVLLRLTKASVFWEFGKYASSAFMILAMVKYNTFTKSDKKCVFYFIMLLPSLLVLPEFDRRGISFNLSGPFCLTISTLFFSTVTVHRHQMARMLIIMMAPILGVAYLATSGTMAFDFLQINESSTITSAGYGPNQMSSTLGLGTLCAFLYIIYFHESSMLRALLICIALWLGAQGALTFSRGGLWNMLGALMVAGFYLFRDRRYRIIIILGGVFLYVISTYVILPELDNFTKGALSTRFQDFDATGRKEIGMADIYVFKAHPFFGVGPGQSYYYHALTFRKAQSHTEYSRLLAEHGSFGVIAMLTLFLIAFRHFTQNESKEVKAIRMSVMVWAFLFMVHAAMRLASPALLFGLGSAAFVFEKNKHAMPETS